MLHHDLHARIEDVAPEQLFRHEVVRSSSPRAGSQDASASSELGVARTAAEEGCSICARALVNAGDLAVDLAMSAATATPSEGLRAKVLATKLATKPRPSVDHAFVDPSAAVAHKHIGAPGDAERVAAIDAIDALNSPSDDAAPALLDELGALVDFTILFVSIVRDERVAYRVQRGLPPSLAVFRELRREMSYCTHCVSANAPLVVEDARAEAFFRASKMVQRFFVCAYVGVPLRTSDGTAIGTLCALDFRPRRADPTVVRALEHFAGPVMASLEGRRRAGAAHEVAWLDGLVEIAGARRARGAVLEVTSERADRLAAELARGDAFARDGARARALILGEDAAPRAHAIVDRTGATLTPLGG